MLNPCNVCPRQCRVDRLGGATGRCRTGLMTRVVSAGAHFGEEAVLVGSGGSGTIFFEGCNLSCVYCQNYHIAHGKSGHQTTARQLARMMLRLQSNGCVNINLVTPTHVAPQILEAVAQARHEGLTVPVVYNCGGYESVEMLRMLEGNIDIYLADFKFASAHAAAKYAATPDYPQVAEAALAEMYRQVGPLELDDAGLAVRGLIVRHLVLPMNLADSQKVIDTVARVAPGAAINVMGQYRPAYRAAEFPELLVLPKSTEIQRLREYAESQGLVRVDQALKPTNRRAGQF